MRCFEPPATRLLVGILALGLLLSACASPPPSPTAAPAKPAESKPAAPAPTAAAAPTVAPAAKPAEAPKPAAQPTAVPKPAAQPPQGGELKVGLWQEPASLDPSNANGLALRPILAIYDTLVFMSTDNKYHPALAESWQVSQDGKSYTFKLKSGIKFHDGTPFNAAAVKASLDRATRPDAKATFNVVLRDVYDRTDVVDDLTARVVTKEPFAPLLNAMSEGYYAITSSAAVQKYGKDFDRNPVGTGPFVFVEWAANDHVTVKRNPDYKWAAPVLGHQGPAYLDRITFKLIPEAGTRLATLETGEMHMIEEPSLQDIPAIEKNANFQVVKANYPGTPHLFRINVERPPTNEVAVRQAMIYAVDQEAISRTVYQGVYPPSHNVLLPTTFAYSAEAEKMYRYNPTKAKELLEGAGWKLGPGGIRQKEGKPLKMNVHIITGVFPMDPLAQIVQAQLREVGIDMEILSMARPPWADAIARGDHNAVVAWSGAPEPDVLRAQFHSSVAGTVMGAARVRDPKLDALLEQGYRALDPAERIKVYDTTQRYIMENAIVIPVNGRMNITVFDRRKVSGLYADARTNSHYYDTYLIK